MIITMYLNLHLNIISVEYIQILVQHPGLSTYKYLLKLLKRWKKRTGKKASMQARKGARSIQTGRIPICQKAKGTHER